MIAQVFIDGEHGTTGLQIQKRLENLPGINLLSIPYDKRHDIATRRAYLNSADIVILCLPDAASREAITLIDTSKPIRILDSSTAHRVHQDWIYGFSEMTKGQDERIRNAKYVANPGCYATGAIAIARPLREAGLLDSAAALHFNAISGYSGGGKQMIEAMECTTHPQAIKEQHFFYGLQLNHKHLAEIKQHGLLMRTPILLPSVSRFTQGMAVHLPLHQETFSKRVSVTTLKDIFAHHYKDAKNITIASNSETIKQGRLAAEYFANTDIMEIHIFANEQEGLFDICAIFDNLGKGAAGAATQNLYLMLGLDEK